MDIVQDNSHRGLLAVASKHVVPEYVGTHELLDKQAAEKLHDNEYADPSLRCFPVDTAANTWLSAAYFAENKGQVHRTKRAHVKETIQRAARIHGNSADVDAVLSKQATPSVPPEQDDNNFCWLIKDASGKIVVKKYPVFDAYGVKTAMEYFDRYRGRYPLEVRREIATNLLKKAQEHGVEPSAPVLKTAGYGAPHRPTLTEELLERAKLTKDAEAAVVFANLNEVLAHCSAEELAQNIEKVADNIDQLDRLNGLEKHYNTKILFPSEVVYAMSMKQASSYVDDALTLHKRTFSIEKLAGLSPDIFGVLGDDLVTDLSTDGALCAEKMAMILPTLPRPDKKLLEDHLVGSFS